MGHSLLAYTLATGGAVTDADMSAVVDSEFSQRSNHYIFTEPYKLMGLYGFGATATRFNLQTPTFNAIGRFNIWPINLTSTVVLSPPRISWLDFNPPDIPTNEEITFKASATALENDGVLMWIQTPGHVRNIPQGQIILPVRATSLITQVSGAWSALGSLTFEQALRGGVYSVVGAQCVGAGTHAFRLVFPRQRYYHGRKLRPGTLATQAIGDQEEPTIYLSPSRFGEWGRFHTFEPPQIEVFAFAAAAVTHEIRLWLVYLGQETSQYLDPWVTQGWN